VSEFKTELPDGVDVEVATFIAYSDGRPTEMILAGTRDENIREEKLNTQGGQILSQTLIWLHDHGVVR
jgi:hypothetical protein